jgi:cyclic pyranopterin phosphate synthase
MLVDNHNRRINYLRLSITDRCNLRCLYCVPHYDVAGKNKSRILPYEDLFRLARESVTLGISKIRVTGGEPLVRPGVIEFLERLAAIEPTPELVLTTNGILLKKLAGPLRKAGVKRLNISLDSLRPEVFKKITAGGELQRVLDGIDAAQEAGFPPPQINVVLLRGTNEGEVADFARLAADRRLSVRFIEYMPVSGDPKWRSLYVANDEVIAALERDHQLTPIESMDGAGPARYFQLDGGEAKLGFISPISHHFCASCNRIRISADGHARGCLMSNETTDLVPYLARGDEAIREVLAAIIRKKPLRHDAPESVMAHGWVPMSAIGG